MKREFNSKGINFTISLMEPEDAANFLEYVKIIGDESENLTFTSDEINFTLEDEVRIIKSFRDNKNELILKAENEDGRIVSGLTFRSSERKKKQHVGEFGISVLKEYWGYGIAKRMIETLEEWAELNEYISKINLRVKEDNERAIILYEKMGYEKEGVTSRAYKIDDEYYSEILMGKDI